MKISGNLPRRHVHLLKYYSDFPGSGVNSNGSLSGASKFSLVLKRIAKMLKTIIVTSMRPANMKNSYDCTTNENAITERTFCGHTTTGSHKYTHLFRKKSHLRHNHHNDISESRGHEPHGRHQGLHGLGRLGIKKGEPRN